ncbi:tRNA (adenine(22)-N(1))-methyltransferase [Alicyclobacillus herbarius]|uniref:tRNA (adenine(22)-N(1))-methyltransferase n=1 Tax=Alicyclobacillus herbarius TaxID=122960 RepID=UPI00040DF2EB|nr:class I SAM-dependent methyltransferase [Alicyclobacillus herbarius]
MSIELSPRLQQVADWVPRQAHLADVGTDHALLPIYLMQADRIVKAVASDVRAGPVQRARRNVARHGLEDRIAVRQGYGLSIVQPGEVDTITLAGLGGQLATEILEHDFAVVERVTSVITQPMGGVWLVRRFFYERQWQIERETVVSDSGYTYMVIEFRPGTGLDPAYAPFTGQEIALTAAFEFGPHLLLHPNAAWYDYVQDKLTRWQRAATGMATSSRQEVGERRAQMMDACRWLANWLQQLEKGAGAP